MPQNDMRDLKQFVFSVEMRWISHLYTTTNNKTNNDDDDNNNNNNSNIIIIIIISVLFW